MVKLRYTGMAPGQAETIRIGSCLYQRGEEYEVDNFTAELLLSKGGFIRVYNKKQRGTVKTAAFSYAAEIKE